jgi:hypothetical protein
VKKLENTLLAKILITTALWCFPLICFPVYAYHWLGFKTVGPLIFLRLLGFAYLALLVAYAFAYRDARSGIYPANTVVVGVVSNFGALLVLSWGAVAGQWSEWGWLAQLYMWVSIFATAAISLALYVFGLRKYGWAAVRAT